MFFLFLPHCISKSYPEKCSALWVFYCIRCSGSLFFFFFLIQSRHLGRAINKADQRVSELQVLIEELQWDMEKIRRRENRLNAHLIEILERVRMCSLPVSLCFTRPIFCLHESQLWHLPESLSGEQQRLQSVWGGQQCLWDHHHQQKKGGNWDGLKRFLSKLFLRASRCLLFTL